MAILPCPFCGNKNIDPQEWMSNTATGPGCGDCGALAESVTLWNKRVAPAVIAYFCVNTVTGKMLYTDSQSEMVAMRDCKAKHWQITELAAVGVQAAP